MKKDIWIWEYKKWTSKEESLLRKYYPKKDKVFLIEFFRRKMSAIRTKAMRLGIKREVIINLKENNGMWKGDKVGYKSLHQWVKKNKSKPKKCEECKRYSPYDLANISGKYKRDLKDWKWLCRRCHMFKDGRINNLKQFRRKSK